MKHILFFRENNNGGDFFDILPFKAGDYLLTETKCTVMEIFEPSYELVEYFKVKLPQWHKFYKKVAEKFKENNGNDWNGDMTIPCRMVYFDLEKEKQLMPIALEEERIGKSNLKLN